MLRFVESPSRPPNVGSCEEVEIGFARGGIQSRNLDDSLHVLVSCGLGRTCI